MDADLDTLATALYVRVDDALKDDPTLAAPLPKGSFRPKLSDAELITVAVLQALAGFVSETRWLRHARVHLRHLFPYLPRQSGYNKRLRAASDQLKAMIRILATETRGWSDDVWLIDSTPVECGRSRPTAKRSDTAGWSAYGYCASHSRYFWGLRLHLICTPAGLPITFALTNPKTDEREVARDMLETEPSLLARRPGQTLIADKGYASAEFEAFLAGHGARLLRPAFKKRTTSARRPAPQTAPPNHRVGQRHPQRPTRSGTPRRPDLRRSRRTSTATRPRPHRRDLAQRHHQPTHPAIPHRLRPLTPGNSVI